MAEVEGRARQSGEIGITVTRAETGQVEDYGVVIHNSPSPLKRLRFRLYRLLWRVRCRGRRYRIVKE